MRSTAVGTENHYNVSVKKQILFTAIITIAFLSLGELSVRTWALYFRTTYERYNMSTGRLELVPNLQHVETDGKEFRINSRGFVGQEFDQLPPPGVTRVIALGDSCTFTLGLWSMAYPAVAERMLNERMGTKKFEYINAGIEGYNSRYALARVREELLQYKPHMVTIYVGWNDLMKQSPESETDSGEPSLIAELLNESYLAKAYKKLIFVMLRPLVFHPKVERDEADRHAYDDYVPKQYERNLRDLIKELKRAGVQAMLFTLPTVVEPGLTAQDLKARGVFFPYYGGSFSVDRLLSLHAAYNRTIRTLGEEEEIPIVDLDEAFNRLERKPLFWDTMHPNERGNAVIAELVTDQILKLSRQ